MTEKDIYRDTPVRYLGYSNEIGESFRSVIDVKWVWLSYGIASAYVIADTISKSDKARKETNNVNAIKTGFDVLLWQSLASVIIPGFTINRICAGAKYALKRTAFRKNSKWITVAVGLTSIPFIIKPIDHLVDYMMDNTIRPFIRTKTS